MTGVRARRPDARRVGLCALLATALLSAEPASAWNDEGHMMVAAIAWQHLNPASRRRAAALLRLNPDYSKWVARVAPANRDEYAFIKASTWADAIKGDPDYRNDGERPSGPDAAQNIGYADRLQHRYWHYIDTPFSTDGTALVSPPAPNAETQIRVFAAAIAARETPDGIKSYDLAWLEHLIGDVHQPLHAVSRFTRAAATGDNGGNRVEYCERSCGKLHMYWDDVLGRSRSPKVALIAASKLSAPPAHEGAVLDEKVWIRESVEAAKKYVYAPPIGPGAGPYTLDAEYTHNARSEARERIALAGMRLAGVINARLK